jgi:hypothetical protein
VSGWWCTVCCETVPADRLLDHVDRLHPDAIPQRWPDGDLVLVDTVPTPGEAGP